MKRIKSCSPDTKKRCSKCKEYKLVGEFYYYPTGKYECYTECKLCLKKRREIKKMKEEMLITKALLNIKDVIDGYDWEIQE